MSRFAPSVLITQSPSPVLFPRFLLVGPYDPKGSEYTFIAPPLGVWRLAGVLEDLGYHVRVFDPNCTDGPPEKELEKLLQEERWDLIGFSITGLTLPYDLSLAHRARSLAPRAILFAGGVEATFNPEGLFHLGPFDLAVIGEGERPLTEMAKRVKEGNSLLNIPGTAYIDADGNLLKLRHEAMDHQELRHATFRIPYGKMPIRVYWKKIQERFRLNEMPELSEREARLAEIRAIRLMTSNYCPMNCAFCSYTNFLSEAQGGDRVHLARLNAEETMVMIYRIVSFYPEVRTIIFQDDVFVLKRDDRLFPLCEQIIAAKEKGDLPRDLRFISSNRIDAMNPERLAIMRKAGFKVLGFGVENFSTNILKEFNKEKIYPYIAPILEEALRLGITPFLDLILTSPRCSLDDYAETVRKAFSWMEKGCEVGMYPYVIPFSGSAMSKDPALKSQLMYTRQKVNGTAVEWDQPTRIFPLDPMMGETLLSIESQYGNWLDRLSKQGLHLPSRVRSLLWIVCSIPVLEKAGFEMPPLGGAVDIMLSRLAGLKEVEKEELRKRLMDQVGTKRVER